MGILCFAGAPRAAATNNSVCEFPKEYSARDVRSLAVRNCDFVDHANQSFEDAIRDERGLYFLPTSFDEQKDEWRLRGSTAVAMCAEARVMLNDLDNATARDEGANLAINAWGSVIMDGAECCTVLNAPFCIDSQYSTATIAIILPVMVLLLVLIGATIVNCFPPKPHEPPEADRDAGPPKATTRVSPDTSDNLTKELYNVWMKSCLRVLPGSPNLAAGAASLFNELHGAFDFQTDNVRNQFEHLISLLRSQCAMVADRAIGKEAEVQEDGLLKEAVGDLHAELLHGFCLWRTKFSQCKDAAVPLGEELPKLAGVSWKVDKIKAFVPDPEGNELCVQLAEITAFLLVWGEAGNVRFMPEILYMITEFMLAAEPADLGELYNITDGSTRRRSKHFLSKIIRPIYNMVFDEWYDFVKIHDKNKKDVKKLHHGFDDYLPADTANYDDWNEFFNEPQQLVEGLLLKDGNRLFDEFHGKRFKLLFKIDWSVSLDAAATKTHRELHSLWAVFATCHRVLLTHALIFFLAVCYVTGEPAATPELEQPIGGQTMLVRFAAVGLLVPGHAWLRDFARWQVRGHAVRDTRCTLWRMPCLRSCKFLWNGLKEWCGSMTQPKCGCCGVLMRLLLTEPPNLFWIVPLVTYALIRVMDTDGSGEGNTLMLIIFVHFLVSIFGFVHLLLIPASWYNNFTPTPVPWSSRILRYVFWGCVLCFKFVLGAIIFQAMHDAIDKLHIARPGHESPTELSKVFMSTNWVSGVVIWSVLWVTTFGLFMSDTSIYFTIACTFLGVGTVFVQRSCKCMSFWFEDPLSKIPERFMKKVLYYTPVEKDQLSDKWTLLWDRMIEYMRYEDKIDDRWMGNLSYNVGQSGQSVTWEQLTKPLDHRSTSGSAEGSQRTRQTMPQFFRPKNAIYNFIKNYSCGCVKEKDMPPNPDAQWRLLALSRGLGLPMPRPYRAPYFPGLTVLIPHYGEGIVMKKDELFDNKRPDVIPLMDWLKTKYGDEFDFFLNRRSSWPIVGDEWRLYEDSHWDKINLWASMRMQTLWRTVGGMCLYHPALQAHFEAQGDRSCRLGRADVWNASDCFTCMISMQMYKFFDKDQLTHTNMMFDKFPDCLKVAYIDCENKGSAADVDGVHQQQARRYYSCLIEPDGEVLADGKKKHRLRLELPGFPILGDGKGDNQNHAIPFMRGHFSQCIDANQGAYFEQMMFLPIALAEFRSNARGDGLARRIVGFPEHITSDIGSVGDMAASAEVAFGTILQRTYAVLGARMHYGHPDLMNKLYMIQQGGVSKATKTLNLSEDIFAGMDFTLRGTGRKIRHCEYFHLAKGRDLGFNSVLGFFSKLSSGTGEQVLTRQTFRLEQVMHLPEALSFYYAHAGYYFTQFFVSWSTPMLIFIWLLVLLNDCEGHFDAFTYCDGSRTPTAEIMAITLGVAFSWLMILLVLASSAPLFVEFWMTRNFGFAVLRILSSWCTLSPLLFIFQAKVIGHYVMNEFRWGGASYVATGRALPTDRRPFVGELAKEGSEAANKGVWLEKVGGLYLDYAVIAHYDGAMLLSGVAAVFLVGGYSKAGENAAYLMWMLISLGLTCSAWLLAPFVFNPYQFVYRHWKADLKALLAFFLENGGKNWVDWYHRTQLKIGRKLQTSLIDASFMLGIFFFAAWFATLNMKVEALVAIYSKLYYIKTLYAISLFPPMFGSFLYCVLIIIFERLGGCTSVVQRRVDRTKGLFKRLGKQARELRKGGGAAGDEETAMAPGRGDEGEGADDGDSDSELEAEAHVEAVDHTVKPDAAPAKASKKCCSLGVPLAVSAFVVTIIDILEAMVTLFPFYTVGWMNAFYAGLILKWGLMTMMFFFAEGILRNPKFQRCPCLRLPLETWLTAHRMMRDVLVSFLIFGVLTPFVLLNSLNDCLCPFCSIHHLLIYRDPGHLMRQEKDVVTIVHHTGDAETPEPPPAATSMFRTLRGPRPVTVGAPMPMGTIK